MDISLRSSALFSLALVVFGLLLTTPSLTGSCVQVQASAVNVFQVQAPNYTLELSVNGTTFVVGETVVFQGVLTPGQVASILLTITITDGSQETRMLTSNSSGDFEYPWYLASAGPYSANAILMDSNINQTVTSNTVSISVSYPALQSSIAQTTQESSSSESTTPSSTTEASTTTTSGGSSSRPWLLVSALAIVAIAFVVAVVISLRRVQASKDPRGRIGSGASP